MGETDRLTTGWEADVPVEDSVLRRFVFNAADRVEHMARSVDGTAVHTEHLALGDTNVASPFGNQAVLLRPLVDDDVTAVVDTLHQGFSGPHVVFSAWPTPDLRDQGYFLIGHPPFMLRPPGGARPSAPAALSITEVDDDASLQAYERVFIEGYPVPEMQPYTPGRWLDTRVLGGIARAWVGAVDGQPVAGSMAFTSRGIVAVENVATLREARGKGFGAALTAVAAMSAPDLPAALIASDDGRPVYERLGFLPISRFTLWAGFS